MTNKITISFGSHSLSALLNDTETAKAILASLPLEGVVNRWGEEIYFSIPVDLGEASDARQEMEVGELAYWPAGTAFCIFFGRTPVSTDDQPRAFHNVNPFGRIDGDLEPLHSAEDGDPIHITPGSD